MNEKRSDRIRYGDVSVPLLSAGAACGTGCVSSLAAAIISSDAGYVISTVVLAIVTLILVANGWLVVEWNAQRVIARSRVFGFAWKHVPWNSVVRARCDEVSPLQWGGWGYRLQGGRSGMILRAGPAIEFVLESGRIFVLTTPRADEILHAAANAGVEVAV